MVIELSGVQFMMIIELSGVQFGLKSYAWFQNRSSAQREFDLKSQVWSPTKIARLHDEVQLPLYYVHFETAQIQDFENFEIKFIHFLGGKSKSYKSSKICHTILYHFPAIWLVTLNKPWNLIGCFVFSVASSLTGEKMWFKAKNGAIRE